MVSCSTLIAVDITNKATPHQRQEIVHLKQNKNARLFATNQKQIAAPFGHTLNQNKLSHPRSLTTPKNRYKEAYLYRHSFLSTRFERILFQPIT
jgi:hypothetical protein